MSTGLSGGARRDDTSSEAPPAAGSSVRRTAGGSAWDLERTWLNTAQYGIPPLHARAALDEALSGWGSATAAPSDWDAAVERTRANVAAIAGARVDDTALGAATSQLVGVVAASVPDGAEVLLPEGEFTSVVFPWLAQADRGVTVRRAPLAKLAEAVEPGTHTVAYSPVQSADGAIAPAADIAAAARAAGARVVADVTQAAGWYPLGGIGADVLVGSAYKWLMAPRGLAFAVLTPQVRAALRPQAANPAAAAVPASSFYAADMELAATARAFDAAPNWFAGVAAAQSTAALVAAGVEQVGAHNTALADRFRGELGLEPLGSAITAIDLPGAAERLSRAGITVTERAGRTRLAFHLYNTDDDVDRAVRALR
ncbi:aminotransferase class V-fold PLP-dependent enzyme [Nocardiopsis coralliicola]